MVQTDRDWRQVGGPTHCSNGHELKGNQAISYVACAGSADIRGHRTRPWRTCHSAIYDPRCLDETKASGFAKR